MPRLSLWRPNKGNDYKFFDQRISEMFTIGGTDVNIHKYLGPQDLSTSVSTSTAQSVAGNVLTFATTANINVNDYVAGPYIPKKTKVVAKTTTTVTLSANSTAPIGSGEVIKFNPDTPPFLTDSVTNIQDLLFLENRDRKYDTSVYTLRTIYRINDNDFDLTQFGLFLTGDTIFMVFHLNDMIETFGRKIIVGDVMELPHLKDFYPLDEGLQAALKRYYVVQDATRASEGFAPTWYPHLWRVKLAPLVDSQEYKDILNKLPAGDTNGDGFIDDRDKTLGELIGTIDKFLDINDAIIQRAEDELPYSGYDTSTLYVAPVNGNGYPGNPAGFDASETLEDASESVTDTTSQTDTPSAKIQGYLTGDGLPPNGSTVAAGITFPSPSNVGDFYLRVDYLPNRLFRYDGKRWVKIEDAVRTNLTPGPTNQTQRSSFVNNENVRYSQPLGWDIIKVADPYTPEANAKTSVFTVSTKTVVTTFPYNSTYGIKTSLNGTKITNTMANISGNIAFTVTNTLNANDLLEYTVFAKVDTERQSLSNALRPSADN